MTKKRKWSTDQHEHFAATMAAKRNAKLGIVDSITEFGKAATKNFVVENPPYNRPREMPPEVIVYQGWFYNRKLEATVIE